LKDKSNFRFKHKFRVHFDECDSASIVHNSNYIKFFERGRIEYFRNLGITWSQENPDDDYYVVVGENYCRYISPSFFDDVLTIYVRISEVKRATCTFEYIIEREDDKMLICQGHSKIVRVKPDYSKATSFSERYKNLISNFEN